MNKTKIYLKLNSLGININGNVEKIPLLIRENDDVELYQQDPYTGEYPNGGDIYFFHKLNGVFKFEKLSSELMNLASAFRSILREHFGENAETNQSITKEFVVQYFLQRQVTRTATQFDAGDVQLLKEGFEKITEWTQDGTTWTFPWYILD